MSIKEKSFFSILGLVILTIIWGIVGIIFSCVISLVVKGIMNWVLHWSLVSSIATFILGYLPNIFSVIWEYVPTIAMVISFFTCIGGVFQLVSELWD